MKISSAIAALGFLFIHMGFGVAADLPVASEVPSPPVQEEKGIWAAIAYSEPDSKHGFFWGADKRQEAMDDALDHCRNAGGKACTVVQVFRNHRHWDDDDNTGFPYKHCGALAVSKEQGGKVTRWSAQSAETRREAEDEALRACEGAGSSCKIREWVCT